MLKPLALTIVAVLGLASLTGCENDAQTSGLIGAAIGAAVGAGLSHDNRGQGAAIGAVLGGGGGYILGNESDKKKAQSKQINY